MTIKTRSILGAALLAPAMLLTACSGSSDTASNAASTAAGGASSAAGAASSAAPSAAGKTSSAPARDASKDVKLDGCALKNGSVHVTATVTNGAKEAANYVVAVDVMQGDKRVDGAALLAPSVAAGKSVKVEQDGTKSDLKGAVTCKVKNVQTMGG